MRERCEAKIEDLDEVFPAAARGEEDVVALQIAVDDAEVVRACEGGAHLLQDVDGALDRHRARASSADRAVPTRYSMTR